MANVTPFPFADVDDLRARWPDMPVGADVHASVLLEDASQFILDTVPTAADASEATRRRIVCAVVRRSMPVEDTGIESFQHTAGPFSESFKPTNPNGDFYLTKQEQKALGSGAQRAFGVSIAGGQSSPHLPWCNLNFGARYCSCGTDIAGEPIFERGGW